MFVSQELKAMSYGHMSKHMLKNSLANKRTNSLVILIYVTVFTEKADMDLYELYTNKLCGSEQTKEHCVNY